MNTRSEIAIEPSSTIGSRCSAIKSFAFDVLGPTFGQSATIWYPSSAPALLHRNPLLYSASLTMENTKELLASHSRRMFASNREHLPDVSPGASPSDEDFRRYAEETFVRISWLRQERSTARSLYGIPVRVDGKPWGAIVVDSRQEWIPNSSQVVKSYLLVASVLGQLLKRS